jgi:hypothetical protein
MKALQDAIKQDGAKKPDRRRPAGRPAPPSCSATMKKPRKAGLFVAVPGAFARFRACRLHEVVEARLGEAEPQVASRRKAA